MVVKDIPGFVVTVPKHVEAIRVSKQNLDLGETEAIALALELKAAILLDEWLGREAAHRLGLDTSGTLGVLVRAKNRGLIPELRPLIARLRDEINFHLAPRIVDEALMAAGE